MLSKTFTSAVVALAASGLVSAQTFTDCNPMEKQCADDEAFGKNKVDCDWSSECKALDTLPGTTISYSDKGALFKIEKESNAPTMASHKRIFFGKVEVELQAAEGQGIVTSIVLESKNLDEIDWEFVGGDNAQVQSNYFGKGDTTTYDRVVYHPVDAPLTSTHTYGIEYTKEHVKWFIDGAEVRTLAYKDAKGGSRFPQTPMEVKVGTWVAGGKNSAEGTVEWAGGYTDFSKAPFNAYYKSISIVDYAGGDAPTTSDVEKYQWTDKTGSWQSIKVIKGDGSSSGGDDDDDDKEKETSTSKTKESSKTEEPSSTKTKSVEKTSSVETSSPTPTPTETTSSMSTPSSTSSDSDDEATTTGSDTPAETSGEGSDSAANGIFASFGRVTVAGVAAAVLAQLL